MNDVIRRKVARAAMAGAEGGPGADQGWRLGFARAARDCTGLLVEVASMRLERRSLAEILDLPPDRALLALLDGPEGGLGLLVMSPEVMAALIEMQTTGRVSAHMPLARRPTRTDAAMVAGTIDRALEELEQLLAEEADLVWAGGFRYASFLEDPRPLGLLLEDQNYRVLSAELTLAEGARKGGLILALPAEGRGICPALRGPAADTEGPAAHGFSAALGEAVMSAGCVLEAVIGRLVLPLREVMTLQVDQMLVLPDAALDRISLDSIGGQRLARARLGQNKGMRALRLTLAEETGTTSGGGAASAPGPVGPAHVAAVPMAIDPGASFGIEPLPGLDIDLPMALDPGAEFLAAG